MSHRSAREGSKRPGKRLMGIAWPMAVAGFATLVWMNGRAPGNEPAALRLIDGFEPTAVEGTVQPTENPARGEFRFDGDDAAPKFRSGPGVEALKIDDGHLVGRTNSDVAFLQLIADEPLGLGDRLHSIEVRARVSAGEYLSMSLDRSDEVDLDKAASGANSEPEAFATALLPDGEFHTYTIAVAGSFTIRQPLSGIRSLVVRPADAEGADFELESIRLVFRKEYLAGLPSGPGWQGLSEIWRESLVTRSPEVVRLPVDLPGRAWLDLSIGTIEDGPVTFEIGVERDGEIESLMRRTVSTPNRWHALPLDLAEFGEESVNLVLTTAADEPGRIAFWGAPVIRNRTEVEQASASDPPRGVVLIITDTLRRDHLPMYGYSRDTAPNLNRLAGQGVLFEDNISQGTWTKVSVPSILTSLYPTSHGITDIPDRLPASVDTLAEVFRNAGYATWATSSVPFSGQLTNLHQGVEVLHERASLEMPDGISGSKTARIYTDRLLKWLDTHRDGPFFAVLHVFDPHSPFEPYRPYDDLWADEERRREFDEMVEKVRPAIKSPFMKRRGLPKREELTEVDVPVEPFVQFEKDLYDGSIRAMDVEIGRLVEGLEELGLAGNTTIALIADHGEEFLEHGNHFHGQSVYGEMTNVPMMLWSPGRLEAGVRIPETVQSLDLAPTLVDLAGLEIPEGFQGQSLLPVIRAAAGDEEAQPSYRHVAFSERVAMPAEREENPSERDQLSIVQGGWRLVQNTVRPEDWPEFELYDHRSDPLNLEDLASDHPEIVERMAGELERWQIWALENRALADDELEDAMSSEELEQLRSLGYVQ